MPVAQIVAEVGSRTIVNPLYRGIPRRRASTIKEATIAIGPHEVERDGTQCVPDVIDDPRIGNPWRA